MSSESLPTVTDRTWNPGRYRYTHKPYRYRAKRPFVNPAPFRAWLRHLMDSSDLPWRVVSLAAEVPLEVTEALAFGHTGFPIRLLRNEHAEQLFKLTPARLEALRTQPADPEVVARFVCKLAESNMPHNMIATLLNMSVPDVKGMLVGERPWCSELTLACARGAWIVVRDYSAENSAS